MDAIQTIVTLRTNRGDIVLRFFPDDAPEHVRNFIAHSRSGYYTGSTFHRVIPGFMIQGGDPNTKAGATGQPGTGGHSYKGPGTSLKAEFNRRSHKRGVLSMARAADPDSAGSQFFICHGDAIFLDGQYSVFGEAIAGLDCVDRIASAARDENDLPRERQIIEEVLVEKWPAEKITACRQATFGKEGG